MPETYIKRKASVQRFLDRLADRLRKYRETNGFTQESLAEALGYANKSTVSRWERKDDQQQQPSLEVLARISQLYGCTLGELIGDISEETGGGVITFARRTPSSALLTEETQADIHRGIEILSALSEGKTLEDLYALPSLSRFKGNRDAIFAFLRTALLSGEITFTHIPRADALERQLIERYPQLGGSVIVVDLPDTMIGEALPPELIAWAAAYGIVSRLEKPSRVGFGTGYTLYRMCANTPPQAQQFSGTQWIPLISFRNDEEVSVNSANYIASLMRHRHHNTIAHFLPYVPQADDGLHEQIELMQREWERLNVAFVGGYGWSTEDNARVPASYRRIFRTLERSGDRDTVAGEFLGYVLDAQGNVVGKGTVELMNEATTRIPLEELQRCIHSTGKVYFVGGRAKKASIVRVVLARGYINGLVTDSDLAKELLK